MREHEGQDFFHKISCFFT